MPWQMYKTHGDAELLASMYPTMARQLAFYAAHTRNDTDGLLHPWTNSQWDFLGDWITPHGSENRATSKENLLFNHTRQRGDSQLCHSWASGGPIPP